MPAILAAQTAGLGKDTRCDLSVAGMIAPGGRDKIRRSCHGPRTWRPSQNRERCQEVPPRQRWQCFDDFPSPGEAYWVGLCCPQLGNEGMIRAQLQVGDGGEGSELLTALYLVLLAPWPVRENTGGHLAVSLFSGRPPVWNLAINWELA